MWSGTTLNNFSGSIFGVHQKIDRIAYRVLGERTTLKSFPDRKSIIHFEGKNGPDGIKAKSPAQNEPWHYIDPFDPEDAELLAIIMEHYEQLVLELKKGNLERAAFEASWLSHAMVDGLTPAHHYPYEEKLIEMRLGEGIETRVTLKEKLVMKGDTIPEKLKNNWLMWGFKGVMVSHATFEWGIAAIISPFVFRQVSLTDESIAHAKDIGFREYYLQLLRKISLMNMYENFSRYGWGWELTRQTRDELIPAMIEAVAMAWFLAAQEAGVVGRVKGGSKK